MALQYAVADGGTVYHQYEDSGDPLNWLLTGKRAICRRYVDMVMRGDEQSVLSEDETVATAVDRGLYCGRCGKR